MTAKKMSAKTTADSITGILLAGGLARRMGGGDKGLLPLGDSVLAARTLALLAAQCRAVCINANRNIEEYEKLGFPVARDIMPDFAGPLAGIHAGMEAADTEWILTAPCDSPFMPNDLAAQMAATAAESQADIVTAKAGGRAHPVFMLARRTLRGDLAEFLQAGGRKIEDWRARHKFAEREFSDASAFANINTPEELREAEKRIGIRDSDN